VHRSHITNINYVQQYKKGKGGEILMTDGSQIPVSSSKKEDFISKFT
jgi:two-component system, LytTR family, response regulator